MKYKAIHDTDSDEVLEGLLKIPIRGGRVDSKRIRYTTRYQDHRKREGHSKISYKIANIWGDALTPLSFAVLMSRKGYLITAPLQSFGVSPVILGNMQLCNIVIDAACFYLTEIRQRAIDDGSIEKFMDVIIETITDLDSMERLLTPNARVVQVLREGNLKRDI